ncbi:MAG: tRNA (adenosine(37)-N6)-threonylcarbamoyltransferase complex ATPase subunit type 1 TsaE [Nitrospirae bacterium]|nr:tRNA (adenosine(37)-N6)-threonylcarbamoyltransferase complex ATPase subunit type 1 TsaE [Nitrospirota bacterium]
MVSSEIQRKYISKGPEETKDIGYRLGRLLNPGDIVGLYGELGAGKTTMVKGIARALGLDERDVVSASFTIITEYDTSPPFLHIDLYRVKSDEELDEIGLWDYLKTGNIAVIEWAEKAEKEITEELIKVKIKPVDENVREITLEGKYEKDRDNL